MDIDHLAKRFVKSFPHELHSYEVIGNTIRFTIDWNQFNSRIEVITNLVCEFVKRYRPDLGVSFTSLDNVQGSTFNGDLPIQWRVQTLEGLIENHRQSKIDNL